MSLKAIGNIGNIGDANYLSGTLTRCMQRTNDIDIRLAAIESFHRLPCDTEEVGQRSNAGKRGVIWVFSWFVSQKTTGNIGEA